MNGIPKPNEYASNKLNEIDGVVAAKVSIVPSIGPTHGVHPTAKAKPNTNDIGYLVLEFFGKNFFSIFNERIFVDNNIKIPKAIMIVPPTKLRLSVNSPIALEKTLLIKTPKIENTTEKPNTKNTVFRTMFNRLMVRTDPLLEPSSVTVVPEMYARKAGIIGRMHGAINEPRPASNATNIVGSAMR